MKPIKVAVVGYGGMGSWHTERIGEMDKFTLAGVWDIDPAALELARANAQRAGVSDRITFERHDLHDFAPQSEKGTLICNPPYGERLLDLQAAEELYRLMGQKFPQRHGWSYSVISPSEDFELFFGRKADKRRKLYNGMIKCQVYMYFK